MVRGVAGGLYWDGGGDCDGGVAEGLSDGGVCRLVGSVAGRLDCGVGGDYGRAIVGGFGAVEGDWLVGGVAEGLY
jgi:hypothetical protein